MVNTFSSVTIIWHFVVYIFTKYLLAYCECLRYWSWYQVFPKAKVLGRGGYSQASAKGSHPQAIGCCVRITTLRSKDLSMQSFTKASKCFQMLVCSPFIILLFCVVRKRTFACCTACFWCESKTENKLNLRRLLRFLIKLYLSEKYSCLQF